jgi:DNA mismatch repair protein MutL
VTNALRDLSDSSTDADQVGVRHEAEESPVSDSPGWNSPEPRYLGQAFGVFLLAELGETLYLVDQHATHERLLLEEYLRRPKEPQELLFPVSFEADPSQEELLAERGGQLENLGIQLERVGPSTFEITALPAPFERLDEGELVRVITSLDHPPEWVARELSTLAACRAAIKEGDPVDEVTALELVRGAFSLDDARCPHGRPLWHEITREELYRRVGRII